jgi:hypothetical protein
VRARITAGVLLFLAAALVSGRPAAPAAPVTFTNGELLGRPTDVSVALNMMADEDVDVYFEFGAQPGLYAGRTETARFAAGTPITAVLRPLPSDSVVYYRTRYRRPGESEFQARDEHSFHTQRTGAESFVFDVEADPHLDENSDPNLYRRTLDNVLADRPDFLIDLGDTFFSEKLPSKTWDTILARHLLLRTYFDRIGHSVPLFSVLGNHEGEWGSNLNGTADNLAVWAAKARLLHYPNPLPDDFYSGDTAPAPFAGLRQNYYAWEWGPALFVVLDPYWYTTVKSSTNNWTMTLGAVQYQWLRSVLEGSTARHKLVFCHQLVGGSGKDGRGGAEAAAYYEWGGKNEDGSSGFAAQRPGWAEPIHRLMVRTGVKAVFHGHDHFFDKQDLDGIVYQLLPQPSHVGVSTNQAAEYGYTTGRIVGGSGHLRITVSESDVFVEFIRARLPGDTTSGPANGQPAFSYLVSARGKSGGIRR